MCVACNELCNNDNTLMPNLNTVHYSLIDDNRSLEYIIVLIVTVVSYNSIWVKKEWEI